MRGLCVSEPWRLLNKLVCSPPRPNPPTPRPPPHPQKKVHAAFASAWAAADGVEAAPDVDAPALAKARRAAAQRALQRSLGGLGLSVQVGGPDPWAS